MGFFGGIGAAKVGAGGIYFLANRAADHTPEKPHWLPALYRVKIKSITTMNSRKKDDLFIVEAVIVTSNCPDRPAGTKASWVVNLKQDAALGNIKGFLAAVNGIDPGNEEAVNAEVTEAVCELAVSKEQPLTDEEVMLECTMIETRAGKPFTLHRWSPVSAAA